MLLGMLPVLSKAQEIAEQKIKVGKSEKAGFVAVSKSPADLVQAYLTNDLAGAGITKHKKKKKFYTYSGISFSKINDGKIDLCYKVEKKKKRSRIYFVVSRGYDNYVSAASDPVIASNITRYLGQIDATIAHNEEIKAKQAEIAAADARIQEQKQEVQKAEQAKAEKEKEMEGLRKGK